MKRTTRPGRRGWVYIDPTRRYTCAVWGKPRPFGRWDPWALHGGVSAFDATCYLKLALTGLREDRHGLPTLETSRGQAVSRLVSGDVVYAFYSRESHAVKVGRTTDLRRRWTKLQHEAGQLRQLVAVWRCPDSRELEHELHQRWLSDRRFGEWFEADPVLDHLRTTYETAGN